jgi:3-oxoacyl-[acyl-carrier protein] reductase
MDLGIKNKIALVTASSRGLSFATALRLSMEGARVALCSRKADDIKKARDEIAAATKGEVIGLVADVSDEKAVQILVGDVVNAYGGIDILVCNAGGPPPGMHEDFTIDDYKKAISLNLLSTINLCYAALPSMKEKKWGRIINITSIAARQPIDNLILSNTARSGVLGFSKTLSNQVAPLGITVNCVCPGYIKTERVEGIARTFIANGKGSEQDFYRQLQASIPVGRIGTPDEFAQAIAFLASEGGAYITGIALQIDGGYSKGII